MICLNISVSGIEHKFSNWMYHLTCVVYTSNNIKNDIYKSSYTYK